MNIDKQRALKRNILGQMRETSQPQLDNNGIDSAGNTDDDLLGLFHELTGNDEELNPNPKKKPKLRDNKKKLYNSYDNETEDDDSAVLPIPMG